MPKLSQDEQKLIEKIFNEQHRRFAAIARNIVQCCRDGEEVVSQAFIKIMKKIDKIRGLPYYEAIPYCVVIVRHEAVSLLRRRKRDILVEDWERVGGNVPAAEQEVLNAMERDRLLQMVAMLPEQDQELVRLRYGMGLRIPEIATLLEIEEATASKRCQRAMAQLKLLYKEGEQDAGDK